MADTLIEQVARKIDPNAWMQFVTPTPKYVARDWKARQASAKERAQRIIDLLQGLGWKDPKAMLAEVLGETEEGKYG